MGSDGIALRVSSKFRPSHLCPDLGGDAGGVWWCGRLLRRSSV
jgi:hypothetical protein